MINGIRYLLKTGCQWVLLPEDFGCDKTVNAYFNTWREDVAFKGLDAPDYATAIDCLAEMGALPDDFALHFRNVAGFRNVLVHGYLDVDLDVIAQLLGRQLDDFETFAHHIERWLTELVE